MVLTSVEGTTANLQLVVENSSCVECIMPRDILEQITLDILKRGGAGIDAVAIDDPALCAELAARGVVLDLCPSSNVQAAIVPGYGNFPILRLRRLGVRVTLNTDDLVVSDVTLSEEYGRVRRRLGAGIADLLAIAREGYAAAFAPEPLRADLLGAFDAWCAERGL